MVKSNSSLVNRWPNSYGEYIKRMVSGDTTFLGFWAVNPYDMLVYIDQNKEWLYKADLLSISKLRIIKFRNQEIYYSYTSYPSKSIIDYIEEQEVGGQ